MRYASKSIGSRIASGASAAAFIRPCAEWIPNARASYVAVVTTPRPAYPRSVANLRVTIPVPGSTASSGWWRRPPPITTGRPRNSG